MDKTQHILVTGGDGQLGCSIRKIAPEYPSVRFTFTDMPEADITNRAAMQELIKQYQPDTIVNCAAYTAVDKAESELELSSRINTDGPRILAEIAKEHDISLIHISTDYVFGGESCRPLHEEHITVPDSVYGKTKLGGERAIRWTECRAAVIRTSWLYSEFGNNFVKTMLSLGKEREELSVVYDQVGTPTYAPDLARAIVLLAQKEINGYEIYHFCNEGVTSWYDFAHMIFEISGIDIKLNAIESDQYPTPAKRPAYSVLSKEKIKEKGIPVPYWVDSLRICLEELFKNE